VLVRLHLATAGESHGPGLTVILSGFPAGVPVDPTFLDGELGRRQHGYGRGRRMTIERDHAEIRGGVRGGETIGGPIALTIENRDWPNWQPIMDPLEVDPRRAEQRRLVRPRPGHADLAGGIKYHRDDLRDILERASARETTSRVAAGALAKMLLRALGIEVRSGVRALGPIGTDRPVPTWADLERVDENSPLRAIWPELEPAMVAAVDAAKEAGDTLGGAVTCIVRGLPVGLGSYASWDSKLDGRLAQAVMSVHAVKAVEIGAGLAAAAGLGSAAHDPIEPRRADGAFPRTSNLAGGLEGGITTGEDLVITAYKKPIATLRKGLASVDLDTGQATGSQYERSDVTAVPAAGVIVEAMVALVVADALLEKVGGDSLAEVRAHLEATRNLERHWHDHHTEVEG
jgi:chorismate synthase